MIGLKRILTILFLCFTIASFGKTQKSNTNSFDVLAKLISFEGGDKIHFAKFKIIKNLSGSVDLNDTIIVGYYNYKQPDNNIDNVFLTLKRYNGQTSLKNYFICPDYNGTKYIQKVKIEFIEFNYWLDRITGKGKLKPLTFSRSKNEKKWFLILTCSGTKSEIRISGPNFSKKLILNPENCPPCFELTNLGNGQYSVKLITCGLDETVRFNLITTK